MCQVRVGEAGKEEGRGEEDVELVVRWNRWTSTAFGSVTLFVSAASHEVYISYLSAY